MGVAVEFAARPAFFAVVVIVEEFRHVLLIHGKGVAEATCAPASPEGILGHAPGEFRTEDPGVAVGILDRGLDIPEPFLDRRPVDGSVGLPSSRDD